MQPTAGTSVLADDAVRYPDDDVWIEDADGVKLIAGRCAKCGTCVFPRPSICPECASVDVQPSVLPRFGQVYSYTTVHPPREGYSGPYTVGYVDFPDNVRVFGQFRHGPDALKLEALVEVGLDVIRTQPDGRPVVSYVFKIEG